MPSRYPGILLAGLILLSLLLHEGFIGTLPISASAGPSTSSLLHLPSVSHQDVATDETADLVVTPVDATWNGSQLLRSRPLILDWNLNPAFSIQVAGPMLTETQSREELAAFLALRGLPNLNIQAVLDRFDDPDVVTIVPDPPLRAALLMLSGFEPYQAVIDSIIEGENETGQPFAQVAFADLGIANAVATILPPSPATGGRYLMQISAAFAGEPPIQLLPAIIHESLHGDGENSGPEELAANILDTVAYGELLTIDPAAAYDGTQLAAYNNLQLYALLNSMGARGGGQIGISTSVSGDVFVGPGLEDFDARSIRASILQDPFYGALGATESKISPTAEAIIDRFPGESSLGEHPHFDENLLALIDRGVSQIITPDVALSLALTLGLSATTASAEASTSLRPATLLDLTNRPLTPSEPSIFDLNYSARPANTTDARTMRIALAESLTAYAADPAVQASSLALFDNARLESTVPENQLRAAIALLASLDPWSDLTDALLQSRRGTPAWRIEFAPLPLPVNAMFEPDGAGRGTVRINEYLIGDSLEVTAAAIVEGILLEADSRTPNTTTIAALMSTVAYATLLEKQPSVASNPTWGTISRNVDTMALLNSSPWSPSSPGGDVSQVGFLAPAAGVTDVLPGIATDATSFQAYVLDSARGDGIDATTVSIPSELLIAVAESTGAPFARQSGGAIIDQTAMLLLDANVSSLLPPDVIASLLTALHLSVAL